MSVAEKNTPPINLMEVVEKLGGAERIREDLQRSSHRSRRMDARRAELEELYPDKWVALLDDGDVIAADSLEGVLKELDERGISRRETVVKLMESSPSVIII